MKFINKSQVEITVNAMHRNKVETVTVPAGGQVETDAKADFSENLYVQLGEIEIIKDKASSKKPEPEQPVKG